MRWLEPGVAEHGCDVRRDQEAQQPSRFAPPRGVRHDAGRKQRGGLQLTRNRSDHLDAINLLQLADLLDRKIGFARNQPLRGEAGRNTVALALIAAAMPNCSISCAK